MKNARPKSNEKGSRPVRILVVAPSFDILGGQAVQAARLVTRLRELSQFEVGFLPINPRLPGVLKQLQAVKYLRTLVTSLLYVVTLLARIPRFDVIHVFSASYLSFVIAPIPAILIARLFGKKVLLNYHSGEAEDHFTRWPSAISTLRLVDEVVVPSAYLVRIFAKFGVKARAINNLIELEHFRFSPRERLRPVFLANRNLETHYGVDCVLRAFGVIQKSFPAARLTVAGDGSQRPALEVMSRTLGLKHVTFVGRVEHDDIVAQYQGADIYLNGSEIDNQPLSILEAFACGLPVVTTDAGGIPDMVSDSATGFVVARGDYKAMARRARQLINDSNVAADLTERAHAECANYSWPQLRGEWQSVYSDLAFGPPKDAEEPQPSRLSKLRKMSDVELRERLAQKRSAIFERTGLSSLTRLPSDRALNQLFGSSSGARLQLGSRASRPHLLGKVQFSDSNLSYAPRAGETPAIQTNPDLLEVFRRRKSAVFFGGFDHPAETIAQFRMRWPEAATQIIANADRIVAGKFDLLGLKNLDFGKPINWHLDPLSGKSAPRVHWSALDYLDASAVGDHKIVWELNRHQYFGKLGQAYWLSGDEKYAETFVAQLNSWMDQNPPKVGINWASSLEIAFRSISWLWAFYFFKNSPALDEQTFRRALKFLHLNALHLENYLSTYFSPNTHLTGEALGLFYLGTILPEFKEAARWRELGKRILVEQLERQIRPDGVYFEQSSYYHRYTTDFYTQLVILSRANKGRLSCAIDEKLSALLDHLMFVTRPDGTSPLFGDDDGGRLLTLDRRAANDFRAALSTGAVLFGRGDYKHVAGELAEETLWLLGPAGVQSFEEIRSCAPSAESKAFPDGGYYVMRDGWHGKANYLLFDCGPHGADNGGHAHADALTIEVAAKGRPVLVDPGTYTYTGSAKLRNSFRDSSAHNVMLVDGQSSSVSAGPFSWQTVASCAPVSWLSRKRFDYVAGQHDGYERLSEPATHTRSLLFLKNDYWVMRDRLASAGSHEMQLRFHLAPRLQVNDALPAVLEIIATRSGLDLVCFGPDGSWSKEQGQFSHCYGVKEGAAVYAFSASFRGNRGISDDVITFMLPYTSVDLARLRVTEVEAIGGRAFEITGNGYRDLITLRDTKSSRVETVRLASDCEWNWARFSNESATPGQLLELLVLNGKRVALDGQEILSSAKQVEYLQAARAGERFRVETSEGLLDLQFPICGLDQLVGEHRLAGATES